MVTVWKTELEKHSLTLDIVITENSFVNNHNVNLQLNKFVFEPMYSSVFNTKTISNVKQFIDTNVITSDNFDTEFYLENNRDLNKMSVYELYNHFIRFGCKEGRAFQCKGVPAETTWVVDYNDIVNRYKNQTNVDINVHMGLPLNWCNVVRRKNLPFLYVSNSTTQNIEELLILLLTDVVCKYKNIFKLSSIHETKIDNVININAWNEWNEQAVLEPNNVYGYANLELVSRILSNV